MSWQEDYILFLTGCVNPNGMSFTMVQNPDVRQKAYIETVEFYLKHTRMRIVFCENSGSDFSSLISEQDARLEFLTFCGNDYDRSLGKGYGEWIIVDYAVKNSRWLRNAKYIIKVSGKLKVINLTRSICWSNFVYDEKNLTLCSWCESGIVDSRCFVATQDAVKSFLSLGNCINDTEGYYFEHQLHDSLLKNECLGVIFSTSNDYYEHANARDFVVPLIVDGFSWTGGTKYYMPPIKGLYDELGYVYNALCSNGKYRGGGKSSFPDSHCFYSSWVEIVPIYKTYY